MALPGIDGFETARRLVGDAATRAIPFLFLTGRKALPDRVEGLRLGAQAYLPKPFAFPELFATLDSILQRCAMPSGAAASVSASPGLGLMGSLGALSLSGVIQAIEGERQTGVLRLVSGFRWGQLAFYQGKIVSATAGSLTGEQAVIELIGWDKGTYTFRAEAVEPAPPLAASSTSLLIRALQHHDERRAAPRT